MSLLKSQSNDCSFTKIGDWNKQTLIFDMNIIEIRIYCFFFLTLSPAILRKPAYFVLTVFWRKKKLLLHFLVFQRKIHFFPFAKILMQRPKQTLIYISNNWWIWRMGKKLDKKRRRSRYTNNKTNVISYKNEIANFCVKYRLQTKRK